ncbi:vacuolar membrane-associated protein iml1 [Aspergillus alliaceus]|uniref:Vacuolar membrane-associated protein IML1 n=1 Tax=Petromyces alliaceus TaxID=209559 RepID=A0A8H6AC33_PETAA|nr:vacuolar membrane-associated protein iml1 [Aspergillus burnettii]
MSLRGPMKHSHLRQVSAASLETLATARSLAVSQNDGQSDNPSTPDERTIRLSSTGLDRRQCSLWVHDETFSKEEILFNQTAFTDMGVNVGDVIEILPARCHGDGAHSVKPDLGSRSVRDGHVESNSTFHSNSMSKFKTPLQSRCLFVVKPMPQEIKTRNPKLELSLTTSIANIFGFKNRATVHISIVDRAQCGASHVDISFRDQFMVRSDMWRLVMSELAEKIIYKGQKIVFMGSIKATVKNIFIRGKKVLSGFFSPQTIPVFRSESAKYVLFIQMSREMWDFDSEGTGDILFSRVINGFLPELFKRWANSDARHLVTIVLFTRVEYDASTIASSSLGSENLTSMFGPNHVPTRDFYRVVVNDMASGHWTTILDELKKDFRTFLRDVSTLKVHDADTPTINGTGASKFQPVTIAGRPSTALRGNILEAIHLASSHLAFDHIDRDMVHTGTSIIVITPGSGVFEVSYESLASTTEALTNRGIAIDLVCLSPMPLHSVPLFKYREPAQRPTTASFSDIQQGGYSPEMRHSFASLSSKTPHLSPKSALLESFTGMGSSVQWSSRSNEWNYGIPHWLDISYWNPETYRESRRILKKDPNAPIPFTVTKQSKVFVPRVRMYEIQMMGVMESEQSNISIPYLSEGRSVSRLTSSTLDSSPGSLVPPKATFRRNSPFRHQLSDSLRPEPFLQNMTSSKDAMLAASKKTPKTFLSWMDNYDENAFQPFPKRRHRRKPSKVKRPSEPEVKASNAHERISARSISRLRENESTRSASRQTEPPLSAPKSPVSSKSASPKKPALKSSKAKLPRISRTISFALRGLNSTPPRAQASTEVNVEHARGLPTSNQKKSAGMFADNRSVDSLSASDSASTVIDLSASPATPQKTTKSTSITPSRPISIKVPPKQPLEDSEQPEHPVIMESVSTTTTEIPLNGDARLGGQPIRHIPRFEVSLSSGSRDGPSKSPHSKALAPWVRSINPCNTPREVLRDTSWFGRWQHAYPRPPHVAVVKWKSLKSPAILPLTTEEFPTPNELASDYLQTPYRVFPNDDLEGIESPKTRSVLLREMISLRLSHGFQIVVGKNVVEASGQYSLQSPNVFDPHGLERDGTTVFLSKGNSIHRLICIDGAEIEVTRYTHRTSSLLASDQKRKFTLYSPAMRTILSPEYVVKDIRLDSTYEEYNWNYADNYVAGHRDYLFNPAQQLHFWRVRYVLIPMRLHFHSRGHIHGFNEDNEEEIHLLGINQLTHIWQRHKYTPPEEKRFESSNKKRDHNPLNIMYQTRNPSEVIAAELDRIILTDPGLDSSPAQLLPESELLERSSISLSSLAQIIQGDKGVRMMDRRWHWRLHYNCFIGFEFTTWLLQNFRDIDSREEAVEFGNELMKHGLFQHVEKRHNFRDGNYFYQISSEYRLSRPESRGSWFPQIRSDKSVPSTPAGETSKDSPICGHTRSDSTEETQPQTPSTPSKLKNKASITLSKTMKYDADPRKRSNRPEVIDLHFDRLHNPENCFHIELSWMNTTPKLIEDAVLSWASTAEKFGLKLVQVPIAEACAIDKTQPFRKPYRVQLKVPPPRGPITLHYNSGSFSQPVPLDHQYFHKALLRKFDFVLDFEGRSSYPADVEVSYSWGMPDYQYSQYIHRSGSLLAQITDEGDFLLLANRLVSTRSAASRDMPRHERLDRPDHHRARAGTFDPVDRISPRLSPMARPVHEIYSPLSPRGSASIDSANLYRAPEHILSGFADFCNDPVRLEQFYNETHVRPASTKVGPAPTTFMDASIPSLELPASVVSHHISAPPGLPSRCSQNIAAPLSELRTPSRDDSNVPRGSPRSGSLRPLSLG